MVSTLYGFNWLYSYTYYSLIIIIITNSIASIAIAYEDDGEKNETHTHTHTHMMQCRRANTNHDSRIHGHFAGIVCVNDMCWNERKNVQLRDFEYQYIQNKSTDSIQMRDNSNEQSHSHIPHTHSWWNHKIAKVNSAKHNLMYIIIILKVNLLCIGMQWSKRKKIYQCFKNIADRFTCVQLPLLGRWMTVYFSMLWILSVCLDYRRNHCPRLLSPRIWLNASSVFIQCVAYWFRDFSRFPVQVRCYVEKSGMAWLGLVWRGKLNFNVWYQLIWTLIYSVWVKCSAFSPVN